MKKDLKVLMITSEYPTAERPMGVPFIKRQVEFLRKNDVDVDIFHFKGNKNLFNYIAAWWRLRKHTAGKHYDLMHAQWGHSAVLALPKRMPWVITFRGNDLEGIIGPNGKGTRLGTILQTVSKTTGRIADGVIVVSESLAKHLKRDDYEVIPSGLDLEKFRTLPKKEARKELQLPEDKKLVLFAASTISNPRKRYELAKAAVEIAKERYDAELIVASCVDHETIPVYMNACDALLLTSVHEGSPNVVKEALACNLPVVSVDVGDVRRRIGNVDGCYVCKDDTKEQIAKDLKRVFSNGERIDGRQTILELDERITTQKVIAVYRNALQNDDAREKNLRSKINVNKRSTEV
jgi:glycosyltransferase involved in cell wall biosynthesis